MSHLEQCSRRLWGGGYFVRADFGDGYECLCAGSLLLLIHLRQGKIAPMLIHPLRYYATCGSFWVSNVFFFWLAVGNVQSRDQLVVVGLINYLWPAFTLLGSIPILHKKASWPLLCLGLSSAFLGIFISKVATLNLGVIEAFRRIISVADENLPAYLFALIAAFAWAFYSNFTRKIIADRGVGAVPIFMFSAGIPLILLGRFWGESPQWSMGICTLLVGWALASGFAFLMWDIGMRLGNVVVISATSFAIPFFSTIITCLVTGTSMRPSLIVASILTVLGAVICNKAVK